MKNPPVGVVRLAPTLKTNRSVRVVEAIVVAAVAAYFIVGGVLTLIA